MLNTLVNSPSGEGGPCTTLTCLACVGRSMYIVETDGAPISVTSLLFILWLKRSEGKRTCNKTYLVSRETKSQYIRSSGATHPMRRDEKL